MTVEKGVIVYVNNEIRQMGVGRCRRPSTLPPPAVSPSPLEVCVDSVE